MKRTVYIIEKEDADRYRKSLLSVRARLIKAFENSSDMSFRKWINEHGEVLDELLEELGWNGRR